MHPQNGFPACVIVTGEMLRGWKYSKRQVESGGFTLMEVLVVICIVAVLAALAAPALSLALARGQITKCTSNQYQLAFALTRYDERQGSLPGWLNPGPSGITGTNFSWSIQLLPFIGRADLFDMMLQGHNVPAIDTFLCPSNRPSRPLPYGAMHYAANVGVSGTNRNDGVFLNLVTSGMTLSLDEISDADGTATTLAFSEKAGVGFSPHAWAYVSTGTEAPAILDSSGTARPPVFGARPVSTLPAPWPIYPIINNKATVDFAPSSAHAGGVIVAFCDGHTAFLRDEPKKHPLQHDACLESFEYGQLLTPRSRWKNGANVTNSAAMQPWLLTDGAPYLLDEAILKP